MCGITGVFEWGRGRGTVSEDLVVRMRETMRHRGPDGEGVFVSSDRKVGFGHRRLAIVDIAGGAQPMFSARGLCLVFNGEIYNYPALRRSLSEAGATFTTNSDTEVILHLYERYGDGCVEHLTGMFAFAIWDPRTERLFFARDPIGEKPFYWADLDGVFVFGSEIKALLEHPAVPREVNQGAMGPYLANLVTPAPQTLFSHIKKLPAGSSGYCDASGVRISRYRPAERPRGWSNVDGDPAPRVRELLDASLRARLMSDVPIGVLLSGGMDSTAIVALLREEGARLSSFTVAFHGQEVHDERTEARWVAQQFGTDHHDVVLSESDALDTLEPLIHYADEPIADPVCVPLFAVCRLAHDTGIKVVLAGEGADELFWGYTGYRSVVERWPRFRALLAAPRLLRQLAVSATSARRRPRRREHLEGIASGRVRPVHMPVGLTGYQRSHLLQSHSGDAGWAPSQPARSEDGLTTLAFDTQEYEFGVRLPELLLMRIDRFSMANSVEARVPFLDPALVDFVYRLPLDQKIHAGLTKYVFRQAIADVVPTRIAQRPKQGFAAPTSEWFAGRHGGLMRELMGQDALRRYFDISYLDRLLKAARADSWESGQILWPILNFGLWHKHWIEGEPIGEFVAAAQRS